MDRADAPPISLSDALAPLWAMLAAMVPQSGKAKRLGTDEERRLGDEILAAFDAQDLHGRLDTTWTDEAFTASIAARRRSSTSKSGATALAAFSLDASSLEQVLGISPTRVCLAGFDAMKDLVQLAEDIEQGRADASATSTIPATNRPAVVIEDVAYDPTLPPVLRDAVISILHSCASLFAIGRAEERGAKLEPWLALALADAFASPYLRGMDLLRTSTTESRRAFFEGMDASKAEQSTINEALARWERAAHESGDAVHFPLREDADAR